MYCPATIRKLNARAAVSNEDKINRSLYRIKDGLAQAAEIDNRISHLRHLSLTIPEKVRQLQLAEEYYIRRRACILALQDTALHLGDVLDAHRILLDSYEERKSLLEGRLLVAELIGDQREAGEIRPELEKTVQEYDKLETASKAIEHVISEYSLEFSKGCELECRCGKYVQHKTIGAIRYASGYD